MSVDYRARLDTVLSRVRGIMQGGLPDVYDSKQEEMGTRLIGTVITFPPITDYEPSVELCVLCDLLYGNDLENGGVTVTPPRLRLFYRETADGIRHPVPVRDWVHEQAYTDEHADALEGAGRVLREIDVYLRSVTSPAGHWMQLDWSKIDEKPTPV